MTGTRGFSASRATAGLTLIELLVVLVIIAMIAAVAWPNVAGAWRESSFVASMELAESALSNARMDAMRRGEALSAEIEQRPDGGVVIVLRRSGGGPPDDGDGGLLPGALGVRGDDAAGGPDESEWRRATPLSLPSGYRIIDPALEPAPGDPLAAGTFEPVAPIGGLGAEPEPLAVATFFPDGSALSVGRLALVDARGRRAWIEVGAVSGRVRLVRDDPPADGSPEEPTDNAPPIEDDSGAGAGEGQ